MVTTDSVKKGIEAGLACEHVEVIGDGQHFQAVIVSKEFEAKIVTNDFNLNKVAQLRGVEVLNINELANALKPVYLPGETMKVFILKEGKEFNQGIAYLDDGTMVVVDNARKMIGKTIDSSVAHGMETSQAVLSPPASRHARMMPAAGSPPRPAQNLTSAPARRAMIAWFNPLPPTSTVRSRASTVSPDPGRRSTW